MSDSDNIKSYSASDIQKYLRGELSQADMHAMENAALDDPFLADAIEGMEMTMNEYGDEVIGSNLSELNAAIEQKATGARVVAMRPSAWWVAAAAIVIIFGGVFVYKNYTSNTVLQSQIAKGENAKPPAQPSIGPADESTTGSTSFSRDSTKVVEPDANLFSSNKDYKYHLNIDTDKLASSGYADFKTTTKPSALRDKDSQVVSFYATKSPNVLPTAPLKFDTVKGELDGRAAGVEIVSANDKAAPKKEVKRDSETTNKDMFAVSKAQTRSNREETFKNQNQSNNIRGRVLDNNNQPIANATVSTDKEKNATTTDQQGYFQLNSRDTQLNANVLAVGFESKRVELNNNVAFNQINLEPNKNSLQEVVVVGYGTKRKKEVTGSLSTKVQDATPVIPWTEYEKYLEKKKTNGDLKFKSGDVVVSFLVDKKGELSSFKIEQSLGKLEDAEAIRLIKEGPSWKLTKGRKVRATVIIGF